MHPSRCRHTSCVTPVPCLCSPSESTSPSIALWLGHEGVETTQIYLHADLAIKERALARTAPADTKPGRYRVPDSLLAFLEAL